MRLSGSAVLEAIMCVCHGKRCTNVVIDFIFSAFEGQDCDKRWENSFSKSRAARVGIIGSTKWDEGGVLYLEDDVNL